MSRDVRLELYILRWLADAPAGLSLGELRARMGDAHVVLGRTLDRLVFIKAHVRTYEGGVYGITPSGASRLVRDAALVG